MSVDAVILVSADVEWRSVCEFLPDTVTEVSPYGEWFPFSMVVRGKTRWCVFFHGGWGKIAAAGSTQYAVDRWSPRVLVNIGTCGGFSDDITPGEILLVKRTLVYDIIEQMGDPSEALEHYTTDLDLSWLSGSTPHPVLTGLLLSADRDLIMEDVPTLRAQYGAVAADWESGAIAYVATRNSVRCLILRGVTDLVGPDGAEAYDGSLSLFAERTRGVMQRLVDALPGWLALAL